MDQSPRAGKADTTQHPSGSIECSEDVQFKSQSVTGCLYEDFTTEHTGFTVLNWTSIPHVRLSTGTFYYTDFRVFPDSLQSHVGTVPQIRTGPRSSAAVILTFDAM